MPHHARRLVTILHTHFDPEWFRLHGTFLPRLVALVDRVLDLLEREADIGCFHLDGQTVLVEDYLAARPEAQQRLARLVAAGRLAVGPWYVLADEVLSSGEALIANLALGTRDALALGQRLDVGYSPDAFGHPAELPAVLHGFGIETAVLWRGVGPDVHGDRFLWKAPDGSAVRVYHLPPWGYETAPSTAEVVERATGEIVPLFVGADHHEPEPDVSRQLTGAPAARLDDMLQALAHDELPTVTGEQRAVGKQWLLDGALSARLPLKQAIHRAGQVLERWAEPLAALAGPLAGAAALDVAWRLHLRNHFHDTLAGTVSDAVALAALVRAEEVEAIAREVARVAWDALVGHDPVAARRSVPAHWRPAVVLWNPVPRPRTAVVAADVTRFIADIRLGPRVPGDGSPPAGPRAPTPFHLVDALSGVAIPVQVIERRRGIELLESPRDYPDQDEVEVVRVAFHAPTVAGWGARVLRVAEGEHPLPASQLEIAPTRLANGHVVVEIAADGTAVIQDRAGGERYAGLIALEDTPDRGDLYTFSSPAGAVPSRIAARGTTEVVAAGPYVGAIAVGDPGLRLTWMLHADSPIVRVVVRHHHTGRDHRLRALVPTHLAGVDAVAGGQFGPVRRGTGRAVAEGAPTGERSPATNPCQRVVAIARGGRGLAVFTGGLPEYEVSPDGTIAITLLRAVGALSRGDLDARPGHAAWATPTPGAQEPGIHEWHLGLAPVNEEMVRSWSGVAGAADDFDLAVGAHGLRNARSLADTAGGVELEGHGLVATALRSAARDRFGIVLRCVNALEHSTNGVWRFAKPVAAAYRERLDGARSYPLALTDSRAVEFEAAGREIVTIRITWAAV